MGHEKALERVPHTNERNKQKHTTKTVSVGPRFWT